MRFLRWGLLWYASRAFPKCPAEDRARIIHQSSMLEMRESAVMLGVRQRLLISEVRLEIRPAGTKLRLGVVVEMVPSKNASKGIAKQQAQR